MEDFIQTRFGWCYFEVGESSALIYGLFVHPEYRGQGKAKRLLTLAISEIRDTGYGGDIGIEAVPKEAGIDAERLVSFYTSMGLKILTKADD